MPSSAAQLMEGSIVARQRFLKCCLTDGASAAATGPLGHYVAFLRVDAPASCIRLLGNPRHRMAVVSTR
jgi:hypothetical protein